MKTSINRVFGSIGICILLVGVLLPLTAQALSSNAFQPPPPPPPPPATSTPTPIPPTPEPQSKSDKVEGAAIELRVWPADETVWQTYFWQDLWTVVQWQKQGVWYDVTGWRGTLDKVVDGTGQKTWWVGKDDLGRGPFRWVVYRNEDGPILVISESFYLPDASGTSVKVDVDLKR